MSMPEKKAAVFRAVLHLLRQGRPLGDLKVSEIAEAAGIGKGTVYEYFPSREELLRDAMQYSRAQGFAELYEAISTAEGFAGRWRVIEETARQLMQCGSVFFSQMPSAGFPQAALQDICGGPQERADTRRMIGEIMTCLTAAAIEEGLAPRMPEPEYLSMVGAGCISGILLRCAPLQTSPLHPVASRPAGRPPAGAFRFCKLYLHSAAFCGMISTDYR